MPFRFIRNIPLLPLLLGIGFAILIAISATTFWLVGQYADDARSVTRTLRTQDQLSNLLLAVRRAESSQRGYLLTGRDEYLEDYRVSAPEFENVLADLRNLTSDRPDRLPVLDKMATVTRQKMAELKRTVELREAGQADEALALVLSDRGLNSMNDLRLLVEKAIADEGKLLASRSETTRRGNMLLLIITFAGAGVVVLVGGFSVFLMQRTLRERESARNELAAINANLEQIVAFRTADLTEANQEIQRFAYIVSHDLRSPLVNIMGFTTELEALRGDIFAQVAALSAQIKELGAEAEGAGGIETLGKDFDEALGFIKTSITKMDRLINAVLRLSREGRREFKPETIDMKEMFGSISETVQHRVVEQGATLKIGTVPSVVSDRLALEQVFSNLIDNALKYGRNDIAAVIEIAGRVSGPHAIYEVRDNGRGIDPHDHERVFELFRRSGQQDRPGEGIGLAHVRALVRRLGGTMGLTSKLGQGSVFTVTLPRRWDAEKRNAA